MAEDPIDHKALGDKVALNRKAWYSDQGRQVMEKGVTAKFQQNPYLLERLMKTAGTTLVECNRFDLDWGIGLAIDDKDIGDQLKWKGQNWLGNCLTGVRNSFR